jgi:hypothetical protein
MGTKKTGKKTAEASMAEVGVAEPNTPFPLTLLHTYPFHFPSDQARERMC